MGSCARIQWPRVDRTCILILAPTSIFQGGFSEALMACLGLAPVSLFWGRDFVKLLAQSAWVLSAPLLCLDQAINQVESGAS